MLLNVNVLYLTKLPLLASQGRIVDVFKHVQRGSPGVSLLLSVARLFLDMCRFNVTILSKQRGSFNPGRVDDVSKCYYVTK